MNYDDFSDAMKENLERWNAEIARLQSRMEHAGDEARARYAEQVKDMKAMYDKGHAEWLQIRDASEKNFAEMQSKTEAAWKDIAEGFGRAWSRLK